MDDNKILLRTNGLPFATTKSADLRIGAMAKQGKNYQRIPWTVKDEESGDLVEGFALERTDGSIRRPERIPIGQRNRLTAPRRPGYKRRYVNIVPGRVKMFEEAGYQMVTDQTFDPDNPGVVKKERTISTTPLGSAVVEEVGGGQQAVLMEIREDWYSADQAKKARRLDEMESQIKRRPKKEGHYGSVKSERSAVEPSQIDMDQGHF